MTSCLDHLQERETQHRKDREKLGERITYWYTRAVHAALLPNPWALLWKKAARHYRAEARTEREAKDRRIERHLADIRALVTGLSVHIERRGPGALCRTAGEREVLERLRLELVAWAEREHLL